MPDNNTINIYGDVSDSNINVGGVQNIHETYQILQPEQNPIFTRKEHPYVDLIRAVHNIWIQGVLDDALRRVNPGFEIKLQSQADAAVSSDTYQHFQIAGNIKQIFTKIDKKLLILGEPASGKTVLMLQLTEQLLIEAAINHRARVPVVVNLSSWAADPQQSMRAWLIDRLKRDYGATQHLVKQLIDGNRIIYMLDGLDEVAQAHRVACLNAINAFITTDTQLVVCSRLAEYHALSDTLNANFALALQPLTRNLFKAYLVENGLPAATAELLMVELTASEAIWEEARKPLFANILIDTYGDRDQIPKRTSTDPEQRVYELAVAPYIARQLDGHHQKPYSDRQTRQALAWLGWQMNRWEIQTFYGEALQHDWIDRLWVYWLLYWVSCGILGGAFGGLLGIMLSAISYAVIGRSDVPTDGLTISVLMGLKDGVIFGLLSGLTLIQLLLMIDEGEIDIERRLLLNLKRVSISFADVRRLVRKVPQLFKSDDGEEWPIWSLLQPSLIIGILVGVNVNVWAGLFVALIVVPLGSLIFMALVGVIVSANQSTSVLSRFRFNQGLRGTLIVGLLSGLSIGLFIGFAAGLVHTVTDGLVDGFRNGQYFGTFMGLLLGFSMGLADVVRHLTLRGLLYHDVSLPLNLTKFIAYVTQLNLMRQVGGGVIFKHRYFQDYFATTYEKHNLPTETHN